MVKGVKRNYDFKKFNKKIFKSFLEAYRPLINDLNRQIQGGVVISKDVKGNRYESLKPTTVKIRKQRGQPVGPALLITGEMKKTRIWRPTPADPTFQISMEGEREGHYYGALHNKGFKTDGKSMIPNQKVPARNWFGVPKDFQEGGKKYDEARRQVQYKLRAALRSSMKKVA